MPRPICFPIVSHRRVALLVCAGKLVASLAGAIFWLDFGEAAGASRLAQLASTMFNRALAAVFAQRVVRHH